MRSTLFTAGSESLLIRVTHDWVKSEFSPRPSARLAPLSPLHRDRSWMHCAHSRRHRRHTASRMKACMVKPSLRRVGPALLLAIGVFAHQVNRLLQQATQW